MGAYSTAVLLDNPQHYWRLTDPGGASLKDLGAQPQGLYSSSIVPVLGYSGPNADGGAALFNGGGYFKSPATQITPLPFTLECFVFQAGPPTVTVWAMAGSNYKMGTNTGLQLTMTGTGFVVGTSTIVPANHWHHIAVTITTSQIVFYLDGGAVQTSAHTQGSQTDFLYAGSDGANGMQGWVSEAAMYSDALTATQIHNHYIAADNIASSPVYLVNGVVSPTSGAVTFDPAQLATVTAQLQTILSAVRKVY